MTNRAPLALAGAAAGVGLMFVTWFAAFHIGFAAHADAQILRGFSGLHTRPHVDSIAGRIASLCNPKPYVYLAAVPVLLALVRRRVRLSLAILTILFGANLTAQLLKPLLAHARPEALMIRGIDISSASWPSGHATAAMSLALCVVLAAPARLRPLAAALGAAFAVAVSYSFLTLGWHYPSDVFGGFLVAVTWTLVVAAALLWADRRRLRRKDVEAIDRPSVREVLGPPAAVVIGGLIVVGLVALAQPHAVLAYARGHATFVIGAAAIGTLGLTLATGVMLLSVIDGGRRMRQPVSSGSGPAPTAIPRRGSRHG